MGCHKISQRLPEKRNKVKFAVKSSQKGGGGNNRETNNEILRRVYFKS